MNRSYTHIFLKVLKNREDVKSQILDWLKNGSEVLEKDWED